MGRVPNVHSQVVQLCREDEPTDRARLPVDAKRCGAVRCVHACVMRVKRVMSGGGDGGGGGLVLVLRWAILDGVRFGSERVDATMRDKSTGRREKCEHPTGNAYLWKTTHLNIAHVKYAGGRRERER